MTHELRTDPLTGLRTIVADARGERPGALARVAAAEPFSVEDDPFAPGHEDRTPPELERVEDDAGGWSARAVPNLYPSLVPDAPEPAPSASPELLRALPATGAHEVIVNAPEAVMSLADVSEQRLADAVALWRSRMRAHAGAGYVHLHVNERPEGGASLPHTHAQLTAMPFVPALVARERERFGAYATQTLGSNLLSDLVVEEVRRRERLIAVDDDCVLLAPYASMAPYAMSIVPRRAAARFEDDDVGAPMLHRALRALSALLGASPPLNLWVRTAPQGAEHFCWHVEIVPRLAQMAGLELGTGLHLNPVAPEAAAAELGALCAR